MHSQDNEDHAFDMNAEHEPIPEADNDNDDMPDMVGDFPDNDYAGIIVFYITFPMQSVPITTEVVSSNSAQASCTRYNIM